MTPPFLRPAASAALRRWAEPALAIVLAAAGLWLATRGGWVLLLAGLGLAALSLGWALIAWRRMRFAGDITAPGMVELDEGRLRYLHPVMGGEVSVADLSELRLLSLRGRRVWRLRDLTGATLLVPLDAAGADGLFDAFASLPGLGSAGLVSALEPLAPSAVAGKGARMPAPAQSDRLVWRRAGRGVAPL